VTAGEQQVGDLPGQVFIDYSLTADAVVRNEVGVVDRFSREFQGGLDIVGA
jgi:hypothetical protein